MAKVLGYKRPRHCCCETSTGATCERNSEACVMKDLPPRTTEFIRSAPEERHGRAARNRQAQIQIVITIVCNKSFRVDLLLNRRLCYIATHECGHGTSWWTKARLATRRKYSSGSRSAVTYRHGSLTRRSNSHTRSCCSTEWTTPRGVGVLGVWGGGWVRVC